MYLPILIRVSHLFGGGESGNHLAFAGRRFAFSLVERAFDISNRDHPLLILIELDAVPFYTIVVLPASSVDRVHRDTVFVSGISSFGSDEHRRLCIFKRSRLAC